MSGAPDSWIRDLQTIEALRKVLGQRRQPFLRKQIAEFFIGQERRIASAMNISRFLAVWARLINIRFRSASCW